VVPSGRLGRRGWQGYRVELGEPVQTDALPAAGSVL